MDAWHPAEETRFFSIGVARKGRLLSVGHSDDGTIVRIITARDSQRMSRFNRKKVKSDDMPDEIDFSNAVRGKYAERFALGSNIVMIRPEIFAAFPGEEAVNDALELLMLAGKQAVARAARRRPAPKAAQAVGSSR